MLIVMLITLTTLLAVTHNVSKPLMKEKVELTKTDIYCLARNAYYEARNDSEMSQIAVTHVVLNRVHDPNFPKEICDVIYQKTRNEQRNTIVCQFSWYCDKRMMGMKVTEESWNQSLDAVLNAIKLYYDKNVDVTQGSTYYHAYYVNPNWRNLEKVTSIGSHIYYKTKDMSDNDKQQSSATRWPFYEKVVLRTN